MKAGIYLCDECGAERKNANHWFAIAEAGVFAFEIAPFDEAEFCGFLRDLYPIHLCGEACLHKRLSKWIATRHQSATVKRSTN